ncbi:unnamed protein product, partial [Effrenium voratum]
FGSVSGRTETNGRGVRHPAMSIHVQDLVGNKYTVELAGLRTVSDLKKALDTIIVDMPPDQQKLSKLPSEQRLQPDTALLEELGVKEGDVLELQVLSWTEAQGL